MIAHSPIRSSPPAAEGGVRVEDAGAVRTLVLDRPSRKNVFTVGMYRTMTRALAEAASSDVTSVVRLASS